MNKIFLIKFISAIGNAHEILISPDKRKQYDHLGDERSFQRNSHHNYRDHDGNFFYILLLKNTR